VLELEALATRLDRPLVHLVATRSRGLLAAANGDLDEALEVLDRSTRIDIVGEPFERARSVLALGTVQRRAKQKRAARELLTEAATTFDRLGAPQWVARANAELERVGGRSDDELTVTERKVAELIAAGRTYREAADELFISPKTVQWNLSKVYRKLGIRSRAELPARLAHPA
jgi:DNA-binding CsgD family transcriptional regulator